MIDNDKNCVFALLRLSIFVVFLISTHQLHLSFNNYIRKRNFIRLKTEFSVHTYKSMQRMYM